MVQPPELLQNLGVSRIIRNDSFVRFPGTNMLESQISHGNPGAK